MARAKVTIKLTPSGPRELRQLPEIEADMRRRAEAIVKVAGVGAFEAESRIGATRARASARTANAAGRRLEAEQRTLSRSIWAGAR